MNSRQNWLMSVLCHVADLDERIAGHEHIPLRGGAPTGSPMAAAPFADVPDANRHPVMLLCLALILERVVSLQLVLHALVRLLEAVCQCCYQV